MRKQLELVVTVAYALLFSCVTFALCGCHSIPKGRSSVDEVDIRGENEVTGLEDKIATKPTPKFLYLFRGILYEYSVYDRFTLQDDLARVEAYYRERGYYEAHARAGRVFRKDAEHVRVEILVSEGKPVVNAPAEIDATAAANSAAAILASLQARIAAQGALPAGKPFDHDQYEAAKSAIKAAYTERGYAYATVESAAKVDLVSHRATATFKVTSGPVCKYGTIDITGLGKLPDKVVRRTLHVREGDPFDSAELLDAEQAALGLGVFASVEIRPKLQQKPDGTQDPVVPLEVVTAVSKLKAWQIGGGIEFDALKTDVHGLVGWENHNFLGGLRSFSVQFRPGVVLYPLRVNSYVAPTDLLPAARLKFEVRQPAFLEPRTVGFLSPQFNVYPLLLTPHPSPEQPVIGYAEFLNAIGLNRQFGRVFAELSENVQVDVPIKYISARSVDSNGRAVTFHGPDSFKLLSTIVLSYPELRLQFDFRDDRIHPHKGVFLSNVVQVAGAGGTASDVKVQPEARVYVPLHRRITWATRASVGFLQPFNYGNAIRNPRTHADASDYTAADVRDYQVTFFRGFFSGGPSSNRGYTIRGVGPAAAVPFLTPAAAAGAALACNANSDAALQGCLTPTAGFTLWELSTELRFTITKPLELATFCDASDVSNRTYNIRVGYLHLSCGLGVRYDTPVGPIRADLGFRVPGAQHPATVPKGSLPEVPPTSFFGVPLALAVGIGEAY